MKIQNIKFYKIIILFSSLVLVTTSLTGCTKRNKVVSEGNNNSENIAIDSEENNDYIKDSSQEIIENSSDKVINSKNNIQESKTDTINNESNDTTLQQEKITENDKIVINEFNDINNKVDEELSNINDDSESKLKATFITIVDFIFYEGEIKGVKFDDLTDSAKENVLKFANNIDMKIENKYPNYKSNISDKTRNAYDKASDLILKGSQNVKDFSKEKLGEDNYNAIIDAKDELIYYTKNAFDIVGGVTSNIIESGKTKIKSWYEKFKN